MVRSSLIVFALLLAPAIARADGPDILAGAFTVTGQESGRGYTGRVDVTARVGDTYALRGEVRVAGETRRWRVTGSARAVAGGFTIDSALTTTVGPQPHTRRGTGAFRLSQDALTVTGVFAGARTASETWRRVDRAGTVVLKVMTFNILGNSLSWPQRQGRVAQLIRDERPDIVFLEEVPGQTFTLSAHVGLLARATGMHGTFRGHHEMGPFGIWKFGNGMLTRGDTVSVDSIDLPRAPSAQEQRSALFCRVEVRPGVRVNAFATHLTSGNTPEKDAVRQQQSLALLRWIARFRERPLLVGGDFNARATSPTVELLTGRRAVSGTTGHLRDLWDLCDMPGTGATYGPANGPVRIDYLFYDPAPLADLTGAPRDLATRGGVRALRSYTRGDPTGPDPASDHRALVATIEMAR
jgi:endonuclease/exonuclease/phosphatase family metal-dependent hydrolase